MAINAWKVKSIRPLNDHIIVADMNFSERKTQSGLYIMSDDMKSTGIRPRWGKVHAVGPEQKDVSVGQWVCVTHGRWTRGVKIQYDDGKEFTIRRIDNNDLLLVTDEEPSDETLVE